LIQRRLIQLFGQSVEKGAEQPYYLNMQAQISALEKASSESRDRLTRIEARMESLASKEDLHRETHNQTWRIISVMALLVGVVYYLAKYVH